MNDDAARPLVRAPLFTMFHSVPARYDLVNRVVTLGLDERWRRLAGEACLAGPPGRVLDLCSGTGDLLRHLAREAPSDTGLVGLDYSAPMLALNRRKLARVGRGVDLVRGNAAALPFATGSFDVVGISFALRNLLYQNPLAEQHLAELRRVLKPGGRLVAIESSQPGSALVRLGFRLHLRWFVGGIGGLLSRERVAYRYLSRSAARFDTPAELEARLVAAGFSRVVSRPLLFGAVALTVAESFN